MTPIMRGSALLLAGLLLSSCEGEAEDVVVAPRPVLSVVAQQTPANSLRLTGTVEARIQTELGFRVLGRMIARHVGVGDIVKKGDLVASIDPLALQLAVKSARSELSNAQAQLTNAVTTEQRQFRLAEARSGTEAALEEAEQARRSASASVEKAQANLDKAEEQLSYAQLHAEFDGVVTATSAEAGQVVSAGQTVVTIARPEERDVVVDVPQFAAQQMRLGDLFEVSQQLDPTIRAHGSIREIAPAADSSTRTRRTKIGVSDPPAAFRLGSVVTVTADVSTETRILLPSSAILVNERGTGVWIVDSSAKRVGFRPITLEGKLIAGSTVQIADGVTAGERVVVAGVHKLKDGQTIRIDQEVSP